VFPEGAAANWNDVCDDSEKILAGDLLIEVLACYIRMCMRTYIHVCDDNEKILAGDLLIEVLACSVCMCMRAYININVRTFLNVL